VNCREFRQRITPAVDRYLGNELLGAFLEHAQKCPPCRTEYELELTTKQLVRSCVKMIRTPPSVGSCILEALSREENLPWYRSSVWWRTLRERPLVKPAIAFALTCVALMVFTSAPESPTLWRPAVSSVLPLDFIAQSSANYRKVIHGMLTPDMLTTDANEVRGFLGNKTAFPVLVPVIRDWDLVGGGINDQGETRQAHLVYRNMSGTLYVYEACWQTAQRGEKIKLPPDVQRSLYATGWYAQDLANGEALVMWATERTLCAAVSNLPKEMLRQRLQAATFSSAITP